MERIVETLPSGLTTLVGGTRSGVKLNRPWQREIVVDPSTCPFCKHEHNVLVEYVESGETWQKAANKFTPHTYHRMIIPADSWPPEMLRTLGGVERIATVLRLAQHELKKREDWTMMSVYIGPSAGQNVTHLHWHLHDVVPVDQSSDSSTIRNTGELDVVSQTIRWKVGDAPLCRRVLVSPQLTIVAGGNRAGQCLIAPNRGLLLMEYDTTFQLASVLSYFIQLTLEKFKSTQGLPPDYELSLVFYGSSLVMGMYVPILNNWGATEYWGTLGFGPMVMPWSHEETAQHLRGEEVIRFNM